MQHINYIFNMDSVVVLDPVLYQALQEKSQALSQELTIKDLWKRFGYVICTKEMCIELSVLIHWFINLYLVTLFPHKLPKKMQ